MEGTRGRQSFLASALGVALALGTAATGSAQKVYTDYDHNANFSQYHTFSVYKVKASDSIMEGRLRSDIEASLREKGWQEVPEGGDVAITAIGNVKDKQEYTTFYEGLGPGWGWGGWGGRWGWGGWGPGGGWGWGGGGVATNVYEVPVGTLAVDMYDTKTHQLVFRGAASDTLSTHHASTNDRKYAKEVEKIFDKLPKKSHEG